MAGDSTPADDTISGGVGRTREAAKWLIGAFAAIAGILVAGSQLSSIGKLHGDRLGWAVAALVVALLALAFAIWLLFDIMLPSQATLKDLEVAQGKGGPVGNIASEYPELLHCWATTIAELRSTYRTALAKRQKVQAGNYSTPPANSDDEVLRANNLVKSIGYAVDDVLSVAVYLNVAHKLRSTRRRLILFATGLLTALSISVFAWAANPSTEQPAGAGAVKLEGAKLSGAHLAGQILAKANLRGTTLIGADLRGADLEASDATNGKWARIDLRGANLKMANLTNVDLVSADLEGADLSGANFTNADLRGARLANAKTAGVTWSNTICPNGLISDANHGSCVT